VGGDWAAVKSLLQGLPMIDMNVLALVGTARLQARLVADSVQVLC
jgi:hypothetical protein